MSAYQVVSECVRGVLAWALVWWAVQQAVMLTGTSSVLGLRALGGAVGDQAGDGTVGRWVVLAPSEEAL
ncbi:hypothetical protein [Streptomyces sp. NPDC058297]|uniref:hypothetical protein n=1 Tax=Streptomyces sp. NPDC058297 TaxID=3346433 RepID=UPI0036E0DD42